MNQPHNHEIRQYTSTVNLEKDSKGMIAMTHYEYKTERIGVREFPPFIRIVLKDSVRKELFFCANKKIRAIKKKYTTSSDVFNILYGKKRGAILTLLSKNPQPARKLVEVSGLSASAVYNFLNFLREQNIVSKKGHIYVLDGYNSDVLSLDDIVKIEEDPSLRRKYGISIKELEVAYFLWDTYVEVAPKERGYARTYRNVYTLADAVHRWRTGRTDIPVWALTQLTELSESDVVNKGDITQYHLPPGIPVNPYYKGEYKLPVRVNSDLNKILIQLLHKMSKNHVYTFPKRRQWLFEKLHAHFGEFDDSTSRVPSAVVEILKSSYRVTMDKSSACIPSRIKARWSELDPLTRITEESSLLLHVISLSSPSNEGFEVTSRSESFLHDISILTSRLGLGALTLGKKRKRPHFRVYLSKGKVDVLRGYTRLFQMYPDVEIWSRIPLNQIAEKVVLTHADCECVERICYEELSRFVESILKSLERKGLFRREKDYLQYKEEITSYFWEQKLIPSPRRVEELVGIQVDEEEYLLYA